MQRFFKVTWFNKHSTDCVHEYFQTMEGLTARVLIIENEIEDSQLRIETLYMMD